MILNVLKALIFQEVCFWKRAPYTLFTLLVLPIILTFFIYGIGFLFSGGHLEYFSMRVGVEDPLTYFFLSSIVLMISLDVCWDASMWLYWEAQIGTIDYVFSSPINTKVYVLLLPAPFILRIFITYLPLAIIFLGIYKGFEYVLKFLVSIIVLIFGIIPLSGIGLMVGGLTFKVRESWSIVGVLNPLLLLLSGIYYPVVFLPYWIQFISYFIPITYIVDACRTIVLLSSSLGFVIRVLGSLLFLSVIYLPLGLYIYSRCESYAKKQGQLVRV